MSIENTGQEARFHQALEKLSERFLHHPDVSLIDIGLNPESGYQSDIVVLRIHVRSSTANTSFPEEVDGIPVIVMPGDYKPESKKDVG
jgi:hypothetical protein